MRKFLILAVGALALVVVAVAVAQEPPTTVTSTTTVSPNKAGTKKKPQGVKLIYKATYTTPGDVEHPIITGGTVLWSPRARSTTAASTPSARRRR